MDYEFGTSAAEATPHKPTFLDENLTEKFREVLPKLVY